MSEKTTSARLSGSKSRTRLGATWLALAGETSFFCLRRAVIPYLCMTRRTRSLLILRRVASLRWREPSHRSHATVRERPRPASPSSPVCWTNRASLGRCPERGRSGFWNMGRWVRTTGKPLPPVGAVFLSHKPPRSFFEDLVLHSQFANDLFEVIGRLSWLVALTDRFLLRVAFVHKQVRCFLLEFLSPTDQLGARDAELLADRLSGGVSLQAFQHGFHFELGSRGLLFHEVLSFHGFIFLCLGYHIPDKRCH
jgi:hypothetical protein